MIFQPHENYFLKFSFLLLKVASNMITTVVDYSETIVTAIFCG